MWNSQLHTETLVPPLYSRTSTKVRGKCSSRSRTAGGILTLKTSSKQFHLLPPFAVEHFTPEAPEVRGLCAEGETRVGSRSQRGAGTHARKAGQPSRGAKVPEEATGRGCTQHGRSLASLGKWFHTAGLSKYVRNIRRQVSHIARELELWKGRELECAFWCWAIGVNSWLPI